MVPNNRRNYISKNLARRDYVCCDDCFTLSIVYQNRFNQKNKIIKQKLVFNNTSFYIFILFITTSVSSPMSIPVITLKIKT